MYNVLLGGLKMLIFQTFILTDFSALKPESLIKKTKAQQKTAEERAAAKKARQAVCICDLLLY
jgi:hypothetical protein